MRNVRHRYRASRFKNQSKYINEGPMNKKKRKILTLLQINKLIMT
jgi:hypothetical protein